MQINAPQFDQIIDIAKEKVANKNLDSDIFLNALLPNFLSNEELSQIPDHRFLSAMTRCVFQSGFHWGVIAKKWPEFEEAFLGFDVNKLLLLSPEQWDLYYTDKRIVRHGKKIKSVMLNATFIANIAKDHKSFAKFIANWPENDLVGLFEFLKKNGNRLGGNTRQYFLRMIGKDCFILSQDVILALRLMGNDISDYPSTKRELNLAQTIFNKWHDETGISYSHLSKILALSV